MFWFLIFFFFFNFNRRNSCLASPGPYYPKLMRSEGSSPNSEISESNSEDRENKSQGEFLDIPMCRKISDCSTNSSLSGDDCEITELQPIQRPKVSEMFLNKVFFSFFLFFVLFFLFLFLSHKYESGIVIDEGIDAV